MSLAPRATGAPRLAMPRAWVWVHVVSGWLPVWVLFSVLIAFVHGEDLGDAAFIGLRSIVPAALLGLVVHRLVRRYPWPRPFRLRFALAHMLAAPLYATTWILVAALLDAAIQRRMALRFGPGFLPFFLLGIWLYVMVAGISYAIDATERAARAEAAAARTQLAALRAQLHPHFLFNALHTVVQLIPAHPGRAQDAAEQLAALLRTTMEEDRDLVSLADEWAFVSRYLDLERIRFGDRLRVHAQLDDDVLDARVPSFVLQTLVENAVRHAATPRVAATDLHVRAAGTRDAVTLEVRDSGDGDAPPAGDGAGNGTGLSRLRERLQVLYGPAARLEAGAAGGGWTARVVLPRDRAGMDGVDGVDGRG
jgi:signal transduction histidine kinase